MTQSISANSLNLGSTSTFSSAKLSGTSATSKNEAATAATHTTATAKPATTMKTTASKNETTTQDVDGDTVTISTQGKNLETTAVSSASSSDDSSSSSSTSSTTDLSSYSAFQLQQMLNNGEITRNEYNREIASREETASTESSVDSVEA